MATPAQIAANRLNSLKSTGPSPAGLAVTRCNALKSGIDAQAQVIPGEDPAELDALAENYSLRFQPSTPEEVFLVDALTAADWELRHLRKIEPKLWSDDAFLEPDSKEAIRLARLHRRLDNAQRSYFRALKELRKCAAEQASAPDPELDASELASFRKEQNLAPIAVMPPALAPQSQPQTVSEGPQNRKSIPKSTSHCACEAKIVVARKPR